MYNHIYFQINSRSIPLNKKIKIRVKTKQLFMDAKCGLIYIFKSRNLIKYAQFRCTLIQFTCSGGERALCRVLITVNNIYSKG